MTRLGLCPLLYCRLHEVRDGPCAQWMLSKELSECTNELEGISQTRVRMLQGSAVRSSMTGHIWEPQTLQFISCVLKNEEDMDRFWCGLWEGLQRQQREAGKVLVIRAFSHITEFGLYSSRTSGREWQMCCRPTIQLRCRNTRDGVNRKRESLFGAHTEVNQLRWQGKENGC